MCFKAFVALGILLLLAGCDAGTAGYGFRADGNSERTAGEGAAPRDTSNKSSNSKTSADSDDDDSQPKPTPSDIIGPTDITGAYLVCYGGQIVNGIRYSCSLLAEDNGRHLLPHVTEIATPIVSGNANRNLPITDFVTARVSPSDSDFSVTLNAENGIAVREISAHYSFDGDFVGDFTATKETLLPLGFGYLFLSSSTISGVDAQTNIGRDLCKTEGRSANLPGGYFTNLMPRGSTPNIHDQLARANWYSTSSQPGLSMTLSGDAVRTAKANQQLPVLMQSIDTFADGTYAALTMDYWTFVQDYEGVDSCSDAGTFQGTIGSRYNPMEWLIKMAPDSNGGQFVPVTKTCSDHYSVLCRSEPEISPPPDWTAPVQP